ncbi:GNAT family N-acetyltransferase [Heyndrickxia acidicola]|uniref:GNAT family N-acetyltransferase n=1 Tax=Heyndrickxia acidicola TaxID=209389 RepID=A0ABU6MJY9_9BACI|nr:GNAT family N-acetyltransferase [Heyndrickxia acidicola]MED1204697.1 GNAT family N-acetyltransferase [Heyndrickxia acidicola]
MELQTVTEQDKPILKNLLQFYIYEFSQFVPDIKLEPDGTYQPFDLQKYREDLHSHAFIIREEGELAGLALVKEGTKEEPSIIEQFFIMRKFMGRGIGREAALQLFDRFPGKWKVWQIAKNEPARIFWRKVICEYTHGHYNESPGEEGRTVQEFEAAGR